MTQKEDIQNAVNVMRKGGVILYPTDTVWGIGCDATNAEAVAKVYKIKQRDDSKALICLTDSVDRQQWCSTAPLTSPRTSSPKTAASLCASPTSRSRRSFATVSRRLS